MKKLSKNVLFIIIGVLLAFTIDVAAEAVISSGVVSYSNTTVSAALDELFSAVDINNKIGTTDISGLGNGTITGAIKQNNNSITTLSDKIRPTLLWEGRQQSITISNLNNYDEIEIYFYAGNGNRQIISIPKDNSSQHFNVLGFASTGYYEIGYISANFTTGVVSYTSEKLVGWTESTVYIMGIRGFRYA